MYLRRLGALAYGVMRGAGKATALIVFAGAASADTVQVVALGDSLTAGYGLPEGEGLVPRLQGWLDANGVDAEIVNAGVSGDTTAGGLARLDWALTEDTDAMIVTLGGNDLLRGLPPEVSRGNLDAILSRVAGERGLPVLLIGLDAPSNYGPAYKADFDAMYAELSQDYDTLLMSNFMGPLVAGSDLATARARYLQDDGIHPNREGVALIVETLGPRVAELIGRVEE
ncbi:Esterase TesA precursor [Jannaschia rubra]|uniref:Esterase TesA n=1 Tax=Jannaschia rubra TaxID=282197 RepID=A0A0M6XU27_9RHOB|nr:Esterase TesA precursor [Jannaschia rubra]SFG19133.1 acyl-CoA thioesterase-1 [Jannaschia rubra]